MFLEVGRGILGVGAGVPRAMRSDNLCLLFGGMLFVLLFGVAGAQSTTPAPSAGFPFSLHVMIDGVVYVMQCNFTGLNLSNCTFAADHGLTVSRVSGSTEIPTVLQGVLWGTMGLVLVLIVMATVLLCWVKSYMGGQTAEYAPVPMPSPGPGPPGYAPFAAGFRGEGQAYGRTKIIGVNLVQPCLASDGP